jgi:hypothetical protein
MSILFRQGHSAELSRSPQSKSQNKKFYITTAIDYVEEFWHDTLNGEEEIFIFQGEIKKSIS